MLHASCFTSSNRYRQWHIRTCVNLRPFELAGQWRIQQLSDIMQLMGSDYTLNTKSSSQHPPFGHWHYLAAIRLQERMASAEESMKEIDEVACDSHELTQFVLEPK